MNPTATRASSAGTFATSPRTRVDHDQVRRLHSQGVGVQNIAVQLGASMEDVRRILEVREPAPSAPPPVLPQTREDRRRIRDERFRTMWLADVPRNEICAALGLSQSTLDLDRARLGLSSRTPGRKRKGTS